MDPTPFYSDILALPLGDLPRLTFDGAQVQNDPSRDPFSTGLTIANLDAVGQILFDETNAIPQLCDIHTALCPLVSRHTE